MNIRKYILNVVSLAGLLMLAAGCGDDDPIVVNPTQKQEKPCWSVEVGRQVAEAPAWEPFADELLSSSMTMTVGLDEALASAGVSSGDKVAAFCDDDCLGVAPLSYLSGKPRFYLYVQSPIGSRRTVTLAYYSAGSQRVYYWIDILGFENDKVVGSARQPFELKLSGENVGQAKSATISFVVPQSVRDMAGQDELAAFVGDECRTVLSAEDVTRGEDGMCQFALPVSSFSEKVHIRYYSSSQGRVYVSREYAISADGQCIMDNFGWQ